MSILETSQIIFNLVISLAVILVATLISIIAYEVIKFIKLIKKGSSELYEKINSFLENISNLSFISKFFKKREKKGK